MKRIVLTGGGTAGHVTPNISLFPLLNEKGFELFYIGSYNGMEKRIIGEQNVKYYGISSGKLRRYFDWRNFTDPFRVFKGYTEAIKLLKKLKPNIVFSKGGFVSVPVVLAAKKLNIPVIIHESDVTPGLANKIAIKGATKVCCNFPETLNYIPKEKGVLTGTPIRKELFCGNINNCFKKCGFSNEDKPILLVMGGSSGAKFINNIIRNNLTDILLKFHVIHICGEGNTDSKLDNIEGYVQFEYLSKEFPDFLAAADIIISRAGANSICEFLAMKKPNILIPLPLSSSRGDQILNAKSFVRQGFSEMLEEEVITNKTLLETLDRVYINRDIYISSMDNARKIESEELIMNIILKYAKQN